MKSLPQTPEQVRAFLSGKRTRFCVPVKPQPYPGELSDSWSWDCPGADPYHCRNTTLDLLCGIMRNRAPFPLGEPIFVKETWADTDATINDTPGIVYRATDPDWESMEGFKWRSPIHMPEWAARIILTPKDCKVMQVQSITDAEVLAEGLRDEIDIWRRWLHRNDVHGHAFGVFWDAQHGKRHPWSANPWVFSYSVEVEIKH